eukprot:1297701-Alexandrium_andersonii.AAC.1
MCIRDSTHAVLSGVRAVRAHVQNSRARPARARECSTRHVGDDCASTVRAQTAECGRCADTLVPNARAH